MARTVLPPDRVVNKRHWPKVRGMSFQGELWRNFILHCLWYLECVARGVMQAERDMEDMDLMWANGHACVDGPGSISMLLRKSKWGSFSCFNCISFCIYFMAKCLVKCIPQYILLKCLNKSTIPFLCYFLFRIDWYDLQWFNEQCASSFGVFKSTLTSCALNHGWSGFCY